MRLLIDFYVWNTKIAQNLYITTNSDILSLECERDKGEKRDYKEEY